MVFMSDNLCVTTIIHFALSSILSWGMDCTCVMTSHHKASSFWLALSSQSAMAISWSFRAIHDVANELKSLEVLYVTFPLWPTGTCLSVAWPTRSCGHHVFERHVHLRAAHSGDSISRPSSGWIPSLPPGTFDPISTNISTWAPVAQPFLNKYNNL